LHRQINRDSLLDTYEAAEIGGLFSHEIIYGQRTPLDIHCQLAVSPIAMKLNRTNRRTCLRRRTSDDGLRRVRRQR